jgi:alkyl hydroperoxide reductase subunit AhpC
VILGVSRDDCLSHADFRDKHGLSVRLLSDEEGEVCRKFGVSQFRERTATRSSVSYARRSSSTRKALFVTPSTMCNRKGMPPRSINL